MNAKRTTGRTADEIMRDNMRAALRRRNIDIGSNAEMNELSSAAMAKAGLTENKSFLYDWLIREKTKSPRAIGMLAVMQYLKIGWDELRFGKAPGDYTQNHADGYGVEAESENSANQMNTLASSRVREYDILATSREEIGVVPVITECPVTAEHDVPADLLFRMRSRAEPAIIRVSGDAMAPAFPDDSFVLVDAAVRHAAVPGVYVIWDQRRSTHYIQRLQPLLGSDIVRVLSDNPAFPAQEVPEDALIVTGLVFCRLDPETWAEKSA